LLASQQRKLSFKASIKQKALRIRLRFCCDLQV